MPSFFHIDSEEQAQVLVLARQELAPPLPHSYAPSPQPCLFACLLDLDSLYIVQTRLKLMIPHLSFLSARITDPTPNHTL